MTRSVVQLPVARASAERQSAAEMSVQPLDSATLRTAPARRASDRSPRFGPKRETGTSLLRLISDSPAAKAQAREWKRAHRRRVLVVDVIVILTATAIAWSGVIPLWSGDVVTSSASRLHEAGLFVALVIGWLVALQIQRSRDISLVGVGAEEYRRVVTATVSVFGIFAVTVLLLDAHLPRRHLAIALALGLTGLIVGRHRIRQGLAQRRIHGEFGTRVVVLGKPDSVGVLCQSFGRTAGAGYRVVGACVPGFDGAIGKELVTATGVVPVLGDDSAIEHALSVTGADALAVAAVEHLGPDKMKKLLWRLESLGTELIVMPGVTDIAGPRLLMTPIDDLPLFHIAPPRKGGPSSIAKRWFDVAFAFAALTAVLPVLVVAALAIKFDDGGPIIFRQQRVGLDGKLFRIYKLRTMKVDAEALKVSEKASVRAEGVFFKSATDSRVTRAGRFLRKTSIDELPQLLNVLGGSMSMVGPRPLLPGEGDSVEHFVERRCLVKPGITGLWQISGRSDVSEAERIRLDHSYVDNWSCVQDVFIVLRTVRAVLKRDGAY